MGLVFKATQESTNMLRDATRQRKMWAHPHPDPEQMKPYGPSWLRRRGL